MAALEKYQEIVRNLIQEYATHKPSHGNIDVKAIIDEEKGQYQVIKTKTPLSELHQYSTSLRSITHGMANFKSKFSEYAVVPGDIMKQLIQEYNAEEAL